MGTAQAEKARETMNKLVTVDPTDPATIAQNNTGGPSVPGDTEADFLALLEGTNFDPSAPITRAKAATQRAKKGKTAKNLLTERDVNNLTTILASVTGEKWDDDNAECAYVAFVTHEDFSAKKKQVIDWVAENNATGILVTPSFSKHRASPVGYDPKKTTENKGKKMLYLVTLDRGEQSESE